jgi:hypothetical protein
MRLKMGQTLLSAVDTTAVIVVRCPDQELTLTCGGHEMAPKGQEQAPVQATNGHGEGTQLGKRYTVEGIDIELLCVKAGTHALAVDGAPLTPKEAKPLPASD